MARFEAPSGISDVVAAPLGDLIASVGRGVAEAQQAIDAQTIENFQNVYNNGAAELEALRSIGYQPIWYHIPEVTAEITVAMTATITGGAGDTPGKVGPRRVQLRAAPVDAAYQSKFNYNVQARSSLKFRIVPVPPPAAASRMFVVPNLVKLTVAEARSLMQEVGIPLDVSVPNSKDDSVITAHSPGAGAVLPSGATVTITEVRAP